MSTLAPVTRSAPAQSERDDAPHFVLENVSWETYESLLRDLGDRLVYVTYDDGSLELMAPTPEHENVKCTLGSFLTIFCLEMEIPFASYGSTTFRRKDLKKGLEPDECYYIQHEAKMRSRRRIRLPKDPPPDLVIEVEVSYRAIRKEKIYAAMGVPEIWRCQGYNITVLELRPDRTYVPRKGSLALPLLPIAQLSRFAGMAPSIGQSGALRAFRDWVRRNLVK